MYKLYIKVCKIYITFFYSINITLYMSKNQRLFDCVGHVKVSQYRVKTIKFLADGFKMPSEVAKELDIGTSHASNVLNTLKEYNLVECVNPDVKKGRLYQNTSLGMEVLKYLD